MEIKDYSDLTQFVGDEFCKMQDNFGVNKPSNKFIEYNEKTLMKYVALYDKPLYKNEKRELALKEAIATMPHGWVWKLFHPGLWAKIKELQEIEKKKTPKEEKKKEEKKNVSDTSVPMVVPSISQYPDVVEENQTS